MIHLCLFCDLRIASMCDIPRDSHIKSMNLLLGLPRPLFPGTFPKIANLSNPSFRMTCPKKPFCLSCIVLIRALSVPVFLSTSSFVTLSIHLILHLRLKNHISATSNFACTDLRISYLIFLSRRRWRSRPRCVRSLL